MTIKYLVRPSRRSNCRKRVGVYHYIWYHEEKDVLTGFTHTELVGWYAYCEVMRRRRNAYPTIRIQRLITRFKRSYRG